MWKFDWRFWLPLIITVLALALPYIWSSSPPPPPKKSLSYGVVSVTPLGPTNIPGFQSLRVLYGDGDSPLEKPYLISVLIVNNGDIEIRQEDFSSPISVLLSIRDKFFKDLTVTNSKSQFVEFAYVKVPQNAPVSQGLKLVDARVAPVSPGNFDVKFEKGPDRVNISPLLLNPGDRISVEMLVTGGLPVAVVQARIAGVKQVEEVKESRETKPRLWPGIFATFLMAIGASVVLGIRPDLSAPSTPRFVRYVYSASVATAPAGAAIALMITLKQAGFSSQDTPWSYYGIVGGLLILVSAVAFGIRYWWSQRTT